MGVRHQSGSPPATQRSTPHPSNTHVKAHVLRVASVELPLEGDVGVCHPQQLAVLQFVFIDVRAVARRVRVLLIEFPMSHQPARNYLLVSLYYRYSQSLRHPHAPLIAEGFAIHLPRPGRRIHGAERHTDRS